MSRWVRTCSAIWLPTVNAGFRLVIGSWKIMAISFPRSFRRLAGLRLVRSRPSNRIEPVTRDTLAGSSPMTARAETVLPEPLSPTSPSVLPRCTVKSAPSITGSHSPRGQELDAQAPDRRAVRHRVPAAGASAWTSWPRCTRAKGLRRLRSTRYEAASRRPLPAQRVAQPVGDQVEGQDGEHDGEPREDERPWRRVDELVAFLQHPSPARRGWLLADPEEAQAGFDQQGEAERQGELDDDRRGHVGHDVAARGAVSEVAPRLRADSM